MRQKLRRNKRINNAFFAPKRRPLKLYKLGTKGTNKVIKIQMKDRCEVSGRPLTLCFIKALASRVDKVVLITYEKPGQYVRENLPGNLSERVHLVDCSEDPLGWQHGGSPAIDGELLKIVQSGVSPGMKTVGVVVDSLLFHILNRPPSYTCQIIQALKNAKIRGCEVTQTVALIHEDLHDDSTVCLIEHMATSTIKLLPAQNQDFRCSCSVVHQRSSGKVIRVMENFNMDQKYTLTEVTEAKPVFTMAMPEPATAADPAANLPFNLSLTDQEKEARSQVKLPYMKTNESKESDGGGKIFYQPDEADDLDEEDPDDDLDI